MYIYLICNESQDKTSSTIHLFRARVHEYFERDGRAPNIDSRNENMTEENSCIVFTIKHIYLACVLLSCRLAPDALPKNSGPLFYTPKNYPKQVISCKWKLHLLVAHTRNHPRQQGTPKKGRSTNSRFPENHTKSSFPLLSAIGALLSLLARVLVPSSMCRLLATALNAYLSPTTNPPTIASKGTTPKLLHLGPLPDSRRLPDLPRKALKMAASQECQLEEPRCRKMGVVALPLR